MCENNDLITEFFGVLAIAFIITLLGLLLSWALEHMGGKPGPFQRIDIEHRKRREQEERNRHRRGD